MRSDGTCLTRFLGFIVVLMICNCASGQSTLTWADGFGLAGVDGQVGGGQGVSGPINALCASNSKGLGKHLYAGGGFRTAGAAIAKLVARWDGQTWAALGGGMSGDRHRPSVEALVVHDDRRGPALYAGGMFEIAGGVNASCIAKWNGSAWSRLGDGTDRAVWALASSHDDSGAVLYAGGDFQRAGNVEARCIGVWDGSRWHSLGKGMSDRFRPAPPPNESPDPHLRDWTPPRLLSVRALAFLDLGAGADLIAGGIFEQADGSRVNSIATWNGSAWSPLGTGVRVGTGVRRRGRAGKVFALQVWDDGGGPALYVGGRFEMAGDVPARNIARWDGAQWTALGQGLSGTVRAFTVFDDGRGQALYAAGHSRVGDGERRERNIARWNGVSWTSAGEISFGSVSAMTAFDDGSGPALFVGGLMKSVDGQESLNIACGRPGARTE